VRLLSLLLPAALLPSLLASPALAAEAQPAAPGKDRVAVLILAEPGTDPSLADNLTEIAIARIAERQKLEMAGTVELRRRLEMGGERPALGCLDEIACLGRVAVALGVSRVVGGTVKAQPGERYLLHLTLTDVTSGRVSGRFFRLVSNGVKDLISATQEGTDDLFRPRPEPGRIRVDSEPPRARVTIDELFVGTTPVLSPTLLPGPHRVRVERENHFPWQDVVTVKPATDLEIRLTPQNLPARRLWPRWAALGGMGAGAAAVGVGAGLGAMSQVEPDTTSRVRVQQDLARRQGLATSANVLFATGAALALCSVAILYLYRADVFGD
jgi:hypothetical protein